MKTAIVYDYIPEAEGGAERALLELISHFDQRDVEVFFGFVVDSPYSRALLKKLTNQYSAAKIHYGPVVRFLKPITFRICNFLLPVFLQKYDLSSFDLVISNTAFLSHSIVPPTKGTHIVYYNTPARFLWNLTHAESLLKKLTAPLLITDLMRFRSRLYDLSGLAHNPRIFAISSAVQERIYSYYNRTAELLFPPAIPDSLVGKDYSDSSVYKWFGNKYFAHVSRIESYKNVDLLIDLLKQHDIKEKIVIMGSGPYLKTLIKKIQKAPFAVGKQYKQDAVIHKEKVTLHWYGNMCITGAVSEEVKLTVLANASAAFSLNDEDFGITKIEELAVGTPVIAYAAGGSLDVITHGINGVLFEEPTADSLFAVLQLHRILNYDKRKIIESAKRFTISEFHHKLETLLNA